MALSGIIILFVIICESIIGLSGVCLKANSSRNGKDEDVCYYTSLNLAHPKANRWNAQNECQQIWKGSHLVMIEDEQVLEFLYSQKVCVNGSKYWIGLQRFLNTSTDSWVWEGEQDTSSIWKGFANLYQQSIHTKYVYLIDTQWMVSDGEDSLYFICQKNCDCEKVSVVQKLWFLAVVSAGPAFIFLLCCCLLFCCLFHRHKKRKKDNSAKKANKAIAENGEIYQTDDSPDIPRFTDVTTCEYFSHSNAAIIDTTVKDDDEYDDFHHYTYVNNQN